MLSFVFAVGLLAILPLDGYHFTMETSHQKSLMPSVSDKILNIGHRGSGVSYGNKYACSATFIQLYMNFVSFSSTL